MTGMYWLCKREVLRVYKVWTQTVFAPAVSSLLFIVVFGLSLGGRIKLVEGFHYREFIVPGLIAMAMMQAAYSNNSASIFQARSDRYINDVLSAPMRPWQMNFGVNMGGWARSLDRRAAADRLDPDHGRAGAPPAVPDRHRAARDGAVRRARC